MLDNARNLRNGDGMKTILGAHLIHSCKPGALMHMFGDGTAVVCHPNDEPYLVNTDCSVERLTPSDERGHVYVWNNVWLMP